MLGLQVCLCSMCRCTIGKAGDDVVYVVTKCLYGVAKCAQVRRGIW